MKANLFTFLRTAGALTGALLVLASVRAAEADAFPSFDTNYIKVSAVGASLNGNQAAYQARTQTTKSGAAGIEDFNYTYDLSKDTNLVVDGKAMAGNADYLLDFKLTKNEVGTFEAGYKRFRTFYDDVGGFFPLNNAWLPIYRQPLYTDRGKFFANATLALPKAPVFTFKYTNETRTGQKDTTIWGDSDLTGIPVMSQSSLNFFPAARKLLPAYINLGERQETYEASMVQTLGNTTVTAMIGGDRISNLDSRSIGRYVGELKPYPAIPSSPPTQIPNALVNNPNLGFDAQGYKEHAYLASGKVETVVTDQVTVYANLSYRHAKGDISGARLIVGPLPTATGTVFPIGSFTSGGRPPYSYTSTGNIKQDVLTGNLGAQLKPMPDLYIDAALRGEEYKDSGHVDATYVNNYVVQATGTVTPQLVAAPQDLKNNEKPWTPAVDVRYTGVRTVALYGSWDYRTTTQDERTNYNSITPGGAVILPSPGGGSDHIKEHHNNASVGANWTPMTLVSVRSEVFVKDHENRFSGYGADAGSFYNLDYNIRGAKFSAVVKPLPVLSFTTRYIIQRGKAQVADELGALPSAGDSRRYTLGESVDWNPNKTVYVQANATRVWDTIVTSYPQVTWLAQTVLHNSDSNYYNGNVIVGFAIDKDTDAQLSGTYYRADNYQAAQAWFTLPYGAGAKEYTLTAGVKYKLDTKTVFAAKVGYIESKNDTTGGFTNFRGPLAYVSVERAF